MKVIRGAVCAQNSKKSIAENSVALVSEILRINSLEKQDILAIFFTATADLNAYSPATAVRTALALDWTAFMCAQEMTVQDGLPCCIRVAIFTEKPCDGVSCYLGEAARLRPDLQRPSK